MEAFKNERSNPWQVWINELQRVLFPAGLGADQHFSSGQLTLSVDLANADPEITNAEIFRIGNTVPANSANFAPEAKLFNAYAMFLDSLSSPPLGALEKVKLAEAQAASSYTMRAKLGTSPPEGSADVLIGAAVDNASSAYRSVFLPAYQLDSSFRGKYAEWQKLSVEGKASSGGSFSIKLKTDYSTPLEENTSSLSMSRITGNALASAEPFLRDLHGVKLAQRRNERNEEIFEAGMTLFESGGGGEILPAISEVNTEVVGPSKFASSNSVSNFVLEVSFTGLGTFSIEPARWWSTTAIRLYQSELTESQRGVFFGEHGVLSRRIYQIIIGFEPTLTLRFDDLKAYECVKSKYQAAMSEGVGIGPFNLNSKALAQRSKVIHYDGKGNGEIIIGPIKSSLPILLGVVTTDTLK